MHSRLDNLFSGNYVVVAARINSDMRSYGLVEELNSEDIYSSINYLIEHCRKGVFRNSKWFLRRRLWSELRAMSRTCSEACMEKYLALPGSTTWINRINSSISSYKTEPNVHTVCIALATNGFLNSKITRSIIRDIKSMYEETEISYINTPLANHMRELERLDKLLHKSFPIMYKTKSFQITRGLLSEFYNEIIETPMNIIRLMERGGTKESFEKDNLEARYRYAIKMFNELKINTLIKYSIQYFKLEPDIVGGYSEYINVVNRGTQKTCLNLTLLYNKMIALLKL